MLRPGSVTSDHSHVLLVSTSFQATASRGTRDKKPCVVVSVVTSPSEQSSEYDTISATPANSK